MTTSKELIQAAIGREEVERVPVAPPFQGYWALALAGVTVKESINNPIKAARAQIQAVGSCGFDAFGAMWDWLAPAEALGCEVKMPEHGTIVTWTPLVEDRSSLDRLRIPDPGEDYRLKAALKTSELLINELGREKYLMTSLAAPFTLAGELRGVGKLMMDTILDPDLVREIVNFSTETTIVYLEEMARMDVDAIILSDPTASGALISKEDFQRFSLPYLKECGRRIRDAGKHFIIHICGDTGDRLELVAEAGADVFSIDYQLDIATAMNAIGSRQAILGNVKPAQTLLGGTSEDVRRESLECIQKGGRKGFILGAGCDIAIGTPLDNVRVWQDVVRRAR